MAKTSKSLSRANKRRVLLAQKQRLERQLGQVSQKLEACMACDTRKLRSELSALERNTEFERQGLYKRLGLTPEQAADLLANKGAGKKASKKAASKKTAKKKTSKKLAKGAAIEQREHGLGAAVSKKIAADHLAANPDYYGSKKAGKKRSKKRSSKKTGKKRAKKV